MAKRTLDELRAEIAELEAAFDEYTPEQLLALAQASRLSFRRLDLSMRTGKKPFQPGSRERAGSVHVCRD